MATVYRDQCHPYHRCYLFDHARTLPEMAQVDYRYRCDECGQRYHVTGSPVSLSGRPLGKPSRHWRRQHPR